jgi:hypothetical protein
VIRLVVTSLVPRGDDKFLWWVAEFPQDTIEAVSEALAEDGNVLVTRLDLEPWCNDVRRIRNRVPVILGHAGFQTITPVTLDIEG